MVKPYVMELDVHCKKRIVVYAEDMADAKAKAEVLVINADAVAISVNDADSLRLECQGEAQPEDFRKYQLYSEYGELYMPLDNTDERLLEKAKQLIVDFAKREYGDALDPLDLENIEEIPVAYTDYEEEELSVEVFVDLKNFKVNTYLGGYLVSSRGSCDNIEDFIQELDFMLDFDDLTFITPEEDEAYRSAVSSGREPDRPIVK